MPRKSERYAGPRGNDIPVCAECGQRHITQWSSQACSGHVCTDRDSYVKGQPRKKLDKPKPCTRAPMRAQQVCAAHGGRTGQAKRAAKRRLEIEAIEADTRALLAAEGLDGIADPVAMIGQLAVEALALKRAAGARVNGLDEIRYTGGLERDERGELRGTGTEQLRAEVALYERGLDRSMRFLEIVVKHTGNQDVDDTKAMLAKLGEALGI